MNGMLGLTPEKARIFRVVHIDNMPWIFQHGLHCSSSSSNDPSYKAIGNPELIARRADWPVKESPGGVLSDYVPFYFTPFSVMVYNLITGWQDLPKYRECELVFLVSSLHKLAQKGVSFLFTDKHAVLRIRRRYPDTGTPAILFLW